MAEQCEGAAPPPSDDAFAALVRPHLAEALKVARNQLGCEHLAWEALQEALLSLWGRGEYPPNPKAWLLRAVLLRSRHLSRTIRRRVKHEHRACLIRREFETESHPSRSVVAKELQLEVRSALRKLKCEHRDVLVLHLFDGLSYDSISERLGVPIGTVRSRLSRAREALMTHLAPEFDDSP